MAHTSEHLAVLGILSDNTRAKKGGGGASNLLEQLKRESRHPESVLEVPVVRVNTGGGMPPRTPPLLVTSRAIHSPFPLSLFSYRKFFGE